MADLALVEKIKTRLGITGDYHNELMSVYIDDVKAYMRSAGVSALILDDSRSIGAIARGVADLWDFGSGNGKFSEVFFQRTIQLVCMSSRDPEEVIK